MFSGIGGLDLGLERAGWKCVGQVEWHPFCRVILARHWPGLPRWHDVRYVTKRAIERTVGGFDAIVGGFPCQDASHANAKRVGVARSSATGLWFEMFRLIGECRPRWVLAENVVGLRTAGADTVLRDLESLGYATTASVVGAWAVGAPHRRNRVFIVGALLSNADRNGLAMQWFGSIPGGKWQASRDNAYGCGSKTDWPALYDQRPHAHEAERVIDDAALESAMGCTAHGVSKRLARHWWRESLRALGNAVVPQVAEVFGRAIKELDQQLVW